MGLNTVLVMQALQIRALHVAAQYVKSSTLESIAAAAKKSLLHDTFK